MTSTHIENQEKLGDFELWLWLNLTNLASSQTCSVKSVHLLNDKIFRFSYEVLIKLAAPFEVKITCNIDMADQA